MVWLALILLSSRLCIASTNDAALNLSAHERAKLLRLFPTLVSPRDDSNRYSGNKSAVHLGQYLFFDTGLSKDQSTSCSTCHIPELGWSNGQPFFEKGMVHRNVPTLWNVSLNRWYFWDGRADSLWAQAISPLTSLDEMGLQPSDVVNYVYSSLSVKIAYQNVFGDLPPKAQADADKMLVNLAKAIAAFEETLVARDSAFDTFLAGLKANDASKLKALSPKAQAGLKVFIGKGNCSLCHHGPNFTDGEFHNIRLPTIGEEYPVPKARMAGIETALTSRYNALGIFSDNTNGTKSVQLLGLKSTPEQWGQFKTPTLRNIKFTAPYMHQGQLRSLQDVVNYYSSFEGAVPSDHHGEQILKPAGFSQEEKDSLIAFLESLTDRTAMSKLPKQPLSPVLEAR